MPVPSSCRWRREFRNAHASSWLGSPWLGRTPRCSHARRCYRQHAWDRTLRSVVEPMHAEIAGAGFAGLTAAIALRRRGWTVRVHEKDAALRAFGAGIFIWENGLRVLQAIGAAEDVVRGA